MQERRTWPATRPGTFILEAFERAHMCASVCVCASGGMRACESSWDAHQLVAGRPASRARRAGPKRS
eukprot:728637-Alexandrium_andersonii.AAC.1